MESIRSYNESPKWLLYCNQHSRTFHQDDSALGYPLARPSFEEKSPDRVKLGLMLGSHSASEAKHFIIQALLWRQAAYLRLSDKENSRSHSSGSAGKQWLQQPACQPFCSSPMNSGPQSSCWERALLQVLCLGRIGSRM